MQQLASLERSVELPVRAGQAGGQVEFDDGPAARGATKRRPDNVTSEPGRECHRVAQARQAEPGRQQGVLHGIGRHRHASAG